MAGLAFVLFDADPDKMDYLRDSLSTLTDSEMLDFCKAVDRLFQRYAENI